MGIMSELSVCTCKGVQTMDGSNTKPRIENSRTTVSGSLVLSHGVGEGGRGKWGTEGYGKEGEVFLPNSHHYHYHTLNKHARAAMMYESKVSRLHLI